MLKRLKNTVRGAVPWPFLYLYREIRSFPQDVPYILRLLFLKPKVPAGFFKRFGLVCQCYKISFFVDCPHMEGEMLQVMATILSLDSAEKGAVVEAGSYKGGSGAKISLAVKLAGRQLILFDSFQGLPEHRETHGKNIYGGDAFFPAGSYKGTLEEVKDAIHKYGCPEVCRFEKGWFEETMPRFSEKVAVAYIDVDLKFSTEVALIYLHPLLSGHGVIFSQDGHLPWIIELLGDRNFWRSKLKIELPRMRGLGTKKLVAIFSN